MLFFVDESWQTISGRNIAALGAVAIQARRYNRFCQEFFSFKRRVLGAQELRDSEIRGQHAFSKAAFKREALHGDSHWLKAIDELFECVDRNGALVFVIWTENPMHSPLRSANTTVLSKPYKQLMFDFRALMRRQRQGALGTLNFDQRGLAEDAAAGSAVTNYLVRTRSGWGDHFIQTPNFTVSAVCPGLQAADVMAHLGAHLADENARPELAPFMTNLRSLRFEYDRGPRRIRCTREIL